MSMTPAGFINNPTYSPNTINYKKIPFFSTGAATAAAGAAAAGFLAAPFAAGFAAPALRTCPTGFFAAAVGVDLGGIIR